jgi:hypothetical protein
MRALCGFLLVSLTLVAPSFGRDILVSNVAGDDVFNGQVWERIPDGSGPVRTIARALRLANAGDRIVLAKTAEPYRESFSLVGSRYSGRAGQPFMIVGNGAILDGSAPIPADAWEYYDQGHVFRFRPRELGIEQLLLNDRPAQRVSAGFLEKEPPKLRPLEWSQWGGMIYFCVEKDRLPGDYRLSYAQKQTGITLYQVEHVAIADLVVQGFRLDGVNAFNSARQIYLARLTCRGNGRSGITVGGASTVTLEGCLVGNNGRSQLLTLPWSETTVLASNLLPLTAPAWVDQGGKLFLGGKAIQGGRERISAQE